MGDKEYIDTDQVLGIMCNRGHYFGVSFNDFEAGERCPICKKTMDEGGDREHKESKDYSFEVHFPAAKASFLSFKATVSAGNYDAAEETIRFATRNLADREPGVGLIPLTLEEGE